MPKYTVRLKGSFACKMRVEAKDKETAIEFAEEDFANRVNDNPGNLYPNVDYWDYQHDETDVTEEVQS